MDLADNDLLDLLLRRKEPEPRTGPATDVIELLRADARPPAQPIPISDSILKEPAMKPSDVKATLSFSDGSPSMELPIYKGTHRPRRDRHPQALRADRQVHLRPGLPVDRVVRVDHHLHRRRQGRAAVPRLPDRAAGRELRLPRDLLPAAVRRAAERRAEERLRQARDQPHDGQRADAVLPARLPPRRAPDGGDDRPGRRAVGLLSRQHRHQQPEAPRDLGDPPDRQDADAGGHGLQVRASASPTSTRRTTCRYAATSCA